jgi:hypothetical protein
VIRPRKGNNGSAKLLRDVTCIVGRAGIGDDDLGDQACNALKDSLRSSPPFFTIIDSQMDGMLLQSFSEREVNSQTAL